MNALFTVPMSMWWVKLSADRATAPAQRRSSATTGRTEGPPNDRNGLLIGADLRRRPHDALASNPAATVSRN
ncbi:hypothetical protein, partial [Aromatoleum petrolei]|uniref:hypothetical protein n=1 Tax=Aromatoleum petrolei TaxID=76116 RepID=UPI001B7CFB84